MTPLLYILAGFLLCLFFGRYLKMAVSLLAFALVLIVTYRFTAWIIPEIADIDWRGFWASGGMGLLFILTVGGSLFFTLGWRARVAATEQDDIDRARQKAAKDRQVA